MLKTFKKHEIDALDEALSTSIEKAKIQAYCECEKLCFCTFLFANYFSNKLKNILSNDKINQIFWARIMSEFDYSIKDNLLSIILKKKDINRESLEKIKNTYCTDYKT